MMNNPRFSIVVPVYNTECYLQECLDSLCNQKYSDFEVILVDDGSTDESGIICDEYSEKHGFITTIHKQNAGVIEARNTGLKMAKGNYIGFLDSDDWVKEEYLLKINQTIEKYNPEIVCFESEKIKAKGIIEMPLSFSGYYDKEQLKDKVYPIMLYDPQKPFHTFGIIPAMWSKFFKKTLLVSMPTIDDRIFWGEDGLFTYTSFLKAESAYFLNEKLYCWRYRMGSACHSYKAEMYENVLLLNDSYNKIRKESPEITESLQYYIVFIYLMLMLNEVKAKSHTTTRIKKICEDQDFRRALRIINWKKLNFLYKILLSMVKYKCAIPLTSSIKIVQTIKGRIDRHEY